MEDVPLIRLINAVALLDFLEFALISFVIRLAEAHNKLVDK